MDDLFRFITVRSAQFRGVETSIPLVGSSGTTPFQDQLRTHRGPKGFRSMADVARSYESAGPTTPPTGTPMIGFADPIATLELSPKMPAFSDQLEGFIVPAGSTARAALDKIVASIFGKTSEQLVATPGFRSDTDRVHDSLIALFLAPLNVGPSTSASNAGPAPFPRRVPVTPLAAYARLLDVIARTAREDATLEAPGAVPEALRRTLLLPPTIFPIDPDRRLKPAGIADLLVVKQHLERYEPGEACRIENILQGESRSHSDKHTLTTETTVTTETEKITETTQELKSTERFAFKQEIESTLKQDTRVKAGVDVSAKLGKTVEIKANVGVAYNTSKEEASKSASTYAREVTTRAASKVTERIKTQAIARTTEAFVDEQDHGFDNSTGTKPIRGVYQWLNKVYRAQIFNYGKRVLFDLTVPEPAAFLTAGAAARPDKPVEPPCFTHDGRPDGRPILAKDLSDDPDSDGYFGKYVARYGISTLAGPPQERVVIAKSLQAIQESDDVLSNLILPTEDLNVTIEDGYYLAGIRVKGQFARKKSAEAKGIGFYVGGRELQLRFKAPVPLADFPEDFDAVFPPLPSPDGMGEIGEADGETRTVPLGLQTTNVASMAFNLELMCKRSKAAYDKWQLQAFSAILTAYQRACDAYRDQLVVHERFAPESRGPLGGSPDENREIMKRELKKAAIQMLARDLIDEPMGAVNTEAPSGEARKFPRPILSKAQQDGRYIRFFEQAFEWEEMTYLFYPYYWGRRSTWYDKVVMEHDDPLFLEFLKAGEARVVVSVRPGFESDVWYYLMTGEIWGGGELPHIGDSDYLSIVDEIKALTGAPGDEQAEGEPWEITLPTQLVLLRQDGKLPAWKRVGDWKWTEDPPRYL